LVGHYEALKIASDRMLDAARAGRWDEVGRIELLTKSLLDQLRKHSAGVMLSAEETESKTRVMLDIVRTDAEIRRLAQPWLARLESTLSADALYRPRHAGPMGTMPGRAPGDTQD
jgi:flagellar protein FliT